MPQKGNGPFGAKPSLGPFGAKPSLGPAACESLCVSPSLSTRGPLRGNLSRHTKSFGGTPLWLSLPKPSPGPFAKPFACCGAPPQHAKGLAKVSSAIPKSQGNTKSVERLCLRHKTSHAEGLTAGGNCERLPCVCLERLRNISGTSGRKAWEDSYFYNYKRIILPQRGLFGEKSSKI